jgi:hypothetical protein
MKKILSLLLCATLCMGIFAACTDPETPGTDSEQPAGSSQVTGTDTSTNTDSSNTDSSNSTSETKATVYDPTIEHKIIVGDVYGKPAVVADTHLIRISNLLGLVDTKDPFKVEMQLREILPPEESNDFCHRCVLHGRETCISGRPKCDECVMREFCSHANSK